MSRKETMADIIKARQSGIMEAPGLLSKLWRIVLHEQNISLSKWLKLLDSATDRGNITKGVTSGDMTFNSLVNGLTLFKAFRIRFELHIQHKEGGDTHIHGVDIVQPVRRPPPKKEGPCD